jgi:hypothetical protein
MELDRAHGERPPAQAEGVATHLRTEGIMSAARFGWLSLLALALLPQLASAQLFTPTFQSPRAGASLGGYLSDLDGGDFAAEAILRQDFGGYELGLRGGILDFDDETDLTLGVEYRNPVILTAAPLDLAVTAGAQALFGDADVWGAQAGLSLGATIVPGAFSLTPYVHPRVAFIDTRGGNDVELLAEIGADLGFADGLVVHLAIGLDEVNSDWGVGVSWRR